MSYKLVYPTESIHKNVEKFLGGLTQKQADYILDALFELKKNPRPHGYLHLRPALKVNSYPANFRLRIGDYRVFYDIDDTGKRVILFAIRKRNEGTYR